MFSSHFIATFNLSRTNIVIVGSPRWPQEILWLLSWYFSLLVHRIVLSQNVTAHVKQHTTHARLMLSTTRPCFNAYSSPPNARNFATLTDWIPCVCGYWRWKARRKTAHEDCIMIFSREVNELLTYDLS